MVFKNTVKRERVIVTLKIELLFVEFIGFCEKFIQLPNVGRENSYHTEVIVLHDSHICISKSGR